MDGNIYKGRNLRVLVAGKPILHATECSFSTTMNFEEIATKDTDGTIQTPGNYTWTLTSNHLVADKDTVTQGSYTDAFELLEQYKNRLPVQVQFTTSMGGDVIISGEAFLSGANISAPVEGAASGDFNFQGNGNFNTERVTTGATPVISSANSINITNGTAGTFEVVANNTPTGYEFLGAVPAGVTINAETGVISFTDAVAVGVYPGLTIRVTNGNGSTSQAVVIIVISGD